MPVGLEKLRPKHYCNLVERCDGSNRGSVNALHGEACLRVTLNAWKLKTATSKRADPRREKRKRADVENMDQEGHTIKPIAPSSQFRSRRSFEQNQPAAHLCPVAGLVASTFSMFRLVRVDSVGKSTSVSCRSIGDRPVTPLGLTC